MIRSKALEIFNAHMNLLLELNSPASLNKLRNNAIKHALIEVREILKTQLIYGEPDNETKHYDYWNAVKKEIKNLNKEK